MADGWGYRVIELDARLTPNFTLRELCASGTAARLGIDNMNPPLAVRGALQKLCGAVLQPVRDRWGPVRVNSGWRSPRLNRAVGGADSSQHLVGEAADIECAGVSNLDLARWIEASLPFDQLILEFYTPGDPRSGWVHVSYREGTNRRQVLTIGPRGTLRGLVA